MAAVAPNLAGNSLPRDSRRIFSPTQGSPRSRNWTEAPAENNASEMAERALADSRNWLVAGCGTKWPGLLADFLAARRILEGILAPGKSQPGGASISPTLSNELLLFRVPVQGAIADVESSLRSRNYVFQVEVSGKKLPRSYAAVKCYLSAVGHEYDDVSFLGYMQGAQKDCALQLSEIWLLSPLLQLELLRELSLEVRKSSQLAIPEPRQRLKSICESLARVRGADWSSVFAELSVTEKVFLNDPCNAYREMDSFSRGSYWHAIQELAHYSERSEEEVALIALKKAQEAHGRFPDGARATLRLTHIGYYLVSEGRKSLESEIGYRPHGMALIRKTLLEAPEIYYFLGIAFAIVGILVFLLSGVRTGIPVVAAAVLLFLPCSEAAIETIHQLIRSVLSPRTIPRLGFKKGIPQHCSTVVAVPSLLVSPKQVQHLVRALEIRYLGNTDENLYFALLTDPPDSPTAFDEKDELAALCSSSINELNKKYAQNGKDRFFHFHRNRTFNATENIWMGWERKRGKLLDFNEFIRGGKDRFPVKAGKTDQLRGVRYVITLDADTQLPRGAAARLVGAIAHPLNMAVIDPVKKTVKAGYGVLQPRIGISVQSANRSRLAYIYSGQTGLDIYTHSISDVYQDLFGEAIFTGKGIYEVEVFHEVLQNRFPSNTILSHDLIEGVYTRTGLASEIELIDDYPSHSSAHSRRKHRWVRGDWQILRWLFGWVPDARGGKIANPLSLLSRWKILDNLRRSVIEAATFTLLIACWFFLQGSPAFWTATAVALLLIPSYMQALLAVVKQWDSAHKRAALVQLFSDFAATQVNVFVFLAFLPHQTLVTLDAIGRTVIRLTVTHKKLLEWETAAQSEVDIRRNAAVDRYLNLTPIITILIALCLVVFRPSSLPAAAPILLLWLLAKPATAWLHRPLRSSRSLLNSGEEVFLRRVALKTWRFFREFSNAEENWLIPDNIQGKDNHAARRLSTTNLGLLFNSQLAACLMGMQTIPRFAAHAGSTMATVKRLPRFHGHLANWYDTQTLEALRPIFLSSVDNGNLACCLWTLKQGIRALMEQPLYQPQLFQSIVDHLDLAMEAMNREGYSRHQLAAIEKVRMEASKVGANPQLWCLVAPDLQLELALVLATPVDVQGSDASWWLRETRSKLQDLQDMIGLFTPWILPEFTGSRIALPALFDPDFFTRISLNSLPEMYSELLRAPELPELCAIKTKAACGLRELETLRRRLNDLAADANALVDDMDFGLFYDRSRKAVSIGFDVAESKLHKSCYDLLASEARSTLFLAIAKKDVPQEVWFQLGRTHTHYAKRDVLISWTGTMFEYLMPALWLKHFPNTLLENSLQGAVDCQRAYAAPHEIPWGISEGAFPAHCGDTIYNYQAFGLPPLALSPDFSRRIVITPYATALALNVQPKKAMENLKAMSELGWLGSFGFYESVEFRGAAAEGKESFFIVHSWMAHHQGMILVSICNLLMNSIFPSMFHNEVRVEATERLLDERPLSPFVRELIKEAPQLLSRTNSL